MAKKAGAVRQREWSLTLPPTRIVGMVWVVLIAATAFSFAVGVKQDSDQATDAAVILILIALVKVRLVGLYFMDLRDAVPILRRLFDTYLLIVLAVLVSIDLLCTPGV